MTEEDQGVVVAKGEKRKRVQMRMEEVRGRKENKKLDVAGFLFWIPVNHFNRNGRESKKSQLGSLRSRPCVLRRAKCLRQ